MSKVNNEKRRQPSKAARDKVAAAFDPAALVKVCELEDFSEYAQRFDLPNGMDGRDRYYYYRDNNSPILAVAHLDSVQPDRRCTVVDTAGGPLAVSGVLDDRLGAYVILELLPKLGIVCDILLTTDEEMAASTARAFDPTVGFNWMIQFDRGGTDVVLYQYESKELALAVEDSGARVGVGSYSDIADLDHLGCIGLNWGVGYRDYHSARAHAWLDDTFRMVARFVKFYNKNRDIHIPYVGLGMDEYADDSPTTPTAEDCLIEADCGHVVDLADRDDYIVPPDSTDIVCRKCGEIPYYQ